MASAYNDKPCDTCEHYDPVLRGQGGKGGYRETNWAWCAIKSKYPAKEGPGQSFPAGVARVSEGELAQPVIVKRDVVVPHCQNHKKRALRLSKADLLLQLAEKSSKR